MAVSEQHNLPLQFILWTQDKSRNRGRKMKLPSAAAKFRSSCRLPLQHPAAPHINTKAVEQEQHLKYVQKKLH